MPAIPVNPADLPVDFEPMDDQVTYTGVIQSTGEGGTDKNGNDYFSLKVEILSPSEWAKKVVSDNYIAFPQAPDPAMDGRARRRAMESGVRLGRLCKSAKFNPGPRTWNTDELVGLEIKFTVRNEEYQGRLMPKINDYLFS